MIAIILAAGQGTRLRPLTNNLPKTLIEIKGQPILSWIFEALPEAINKIIIVRGYKGKSIEQKFGRRHHNQPIEYVNQQELDGTYGALWLTKKLLPKQEKFLVLHGDNLYGAEDLEQLIRYENLAIGVFKDVRPTLKLILETGSTNRLIGAHLPSAAELNESNYICTGSYLLDQQIFQIEPITLGNGEKGLPQTVIELARTIPIQLCEFNEWTEINTFEDLNKVQL